MAEAEVVGFRQRTGRGTHLALLFYERRRRVLLTDPGGAGRPRRALSRHDEFQFSKSGSHFGPKMEGAEANQKLTISAENS